MQVKEKSIPPELREVGPNKDTISIVTGGITKTYKIGVLYNCDLGKVTQCYFLQRKGVRGMERVFTALNPPPQNMSGDFINSTLAIVPKEHSRWKHDHVKLDNASIHRLWDYAMLLRRHLDSEVISTICTISLSFEAVVCYKHTCMTDMRDILAYLGLQNTQ